MWDYGTVSESEWANFLFTLRLAILIDGEEVSSSSTVTETTEQNILESLGSWTFESVVFASRELGHLAMTRRFSLNRVWRMSSATGYRVVAITSRYGVC